MLEVRTEKGNECYVILSGVAEGGVLGVMQCKSCTETWYLHTTDGADIADAIIGFIDNHKCRGTKVYTKQMLLRALKKAYSGN